MGFISTKCPSCGASINISDEKKAAFCTYCGSRVVSEAWANRKIVEHVYETPQFEINAGILVRYFGEDPVVRIPSQVKVIQANAFNGLSITEVTFPASIESIETCAFNACDQLKTLNLEDGFSATGFDLGAFYLCWGLRVIYTEGSIGSNVDLLYALKSGEIRFGSRKLFSTYVDRLKGTGASRSELEARLKRLTAEREGADRRRRRAIDADIDEINRRLNQSPSFPKLVLKV